MIEDSDEIKLHKKENVFLVCKDVLSSFILSQVNLIHYVGLKLMSAFIITLDLVVRFNYTLGTTKV